MAKAPWDMALCPSGARWAVANEARGVATRVDRGQPRRPTLMVREAPGGLEHAVTSAWAAAGLPVVVVPPRPARDGARATGQLAQTAALEARARAHGADVIRPTPRPRPDAQTQARRALVGRRQPLSVMRPAAPHRLAGTSARLTQAIVAPMTWRNAASATLANARETTRRASPLGRDNDELVQSAPGMGPVWARTFLRERPELGPRTRQHLAAFVGVAPRNGARGTLRGRRTIWGGRAQGRTVVSRGTLVATRSNPPSTACSERLLAVGKGKKVALTACMQKWRTMLHARLPQRPPWQPQEVQN